MHEIANAALDAFSELGRTLGPGPGEVKCLDCDYRIYRREGGWTDMLIFGRCVKCHCKVTTPNTGATHD